MEASQDVSRQVSFSATLFTPPVGITVTTSLSCGRELGQAISPCLWRAEKLSTLNLA
jgi:hypothetical protein